MISMFLIKFTENDKRIALILLAVLILVLILIALIGYVITRIMRYQGKQINKYVTDVVVTRVITDEGEFIKYAKKKNRWIFYHQGRIPLIIVIASLIFYFIMVGIQGPFNPFDMHTGFGSLLFIWDFSHIISVPENGIGLLLTWPELINTPTIVAEAWPSYVFIPLIFISGIWYLITVQGFIARFIQIKKLGQKIFQDRIENFSIDNNNNNNNNNNNQPNNPVEDIQ